MADRFRVDQDAEADHESARDIDAGGDDEVDARVEQRGTIDHRSRIGDGDHEVSLEQDSATDDRFSVDMEAAARPVVVDLRIRASQRDEADQRADVDVDHDGAEDEGTGVEAFIEHRLDIEQRTDVFADLEDDDGVLRLEIEIEIDTELEDESDIEIDVEKDGSEDDVEAEIDQHTRVTDATDVRVVVDDDIDGASVGIAIDKLITSDMDDRVEVDLSGDRAAIGAVSDTDADVGVHVDVFVIA